MSSPVKETTPEPARATLAVILSPISPKGVAGVTNILLFSRSTALTVADGGRELRTELTVSPTTL